MGKQPAREINRQVYCLTRGKAFSKDFALKNQIRSASISIMSNIAEGHESQTGNTFIRHLGIAKGSAGEVSSQLYTALDQSYINEAEFNLVAELSRKASSQIAGLMQYLKCRRPPET